MTKRNLHLGTFAKYWEPGRVKTRLAATLGTEQAAAVYQAFVTNIVLRMQNFGASRELTISPFSRRKEFNSFLHDLGVSDQWDVVDQEDGNLGERMERFFHRTLAQATSVVLIGTDSPNVPVSIFDEAARILEEKKVVLGPTEDGGYYLVGASGSVPPIFNDVAWSTAAVWEQTTQRLEEMKIDFGILPTWYDVDEQSALDRLRSSIAESEPLLCEQLNRILD